MTGALHVIASVTISNKIQNEDILVLVVSVLQ